jgi:hypothetical protein
MALTNEADVVDPVEAKRAEHRSSLDRELHLERLRGGLQTRILNVGKGWDKQKTVRGRTTVENSGPAFAVVGGLVF